MSVVVRPAEGWQYKRNAAGFVKRQYDRDIKLTPLDLHELPRKVMKAARRLCIYGVDSQDSMWNLYTTSTVDVRQKLLVAATTISSHMKTTKWCIESCAAVLASPDKDASQRPTFTPRDDEEMMLE